MAKIESIAIATARIPLDNATSFATRTVSARDYGLVRVRAGGFEGIGFCYAGSSGGTLVAQAVEQLLAPGLLGRESLLVEGLWQRMFEETLLHGRDLDPRLCALGSEVARVETSALQVSRRCGG
jgi:L-alanine-DL-glutamate epimerase-like enolase superfamily enzyme